MKGIIIHYSVSFTRGTYVYKKGGGIGGKTSSSDYRIGIKWDENFEQFRRGWLPLDFGKVLRKNNRDRD